MLILDLLCRLGLLGSLLTVPGVRGNHKNKESAETKTKFTWPKPCTSLENFEPSHAQKNMYDLYHDPESYFASPMLQKCHLSHVSIPDLEPGPDMEYLWISFMGDTMIRDIFMAAIMRLSGYIPKRNYGHVLPTALPILGSHFGIQNELDLGGPFDFYHESKLFCCPAKVQDRVPKTGDSDVDSNSSKCFYAMQRTMDIPFEKFPQYAEFFFDDMEWYVNNFVRKRYDGKFVCISMNWAPKFGEAAQAITRLNRFKIKPSAVIMNMGLHQNNETEREIVHLRHITDDISERFRTTFVLHSPTMMNRTAAHFHSSVKKATVELAVETVKKELHKWPALDGRYLDIYNISRELHKTADCGDSDGVHLNPWCDYQSLCMQWDFNWLRYLNVIGR